jgi:hypothetical protein
LGDARLTIRLPAETAVATGDTLPIALPEHRINLFDSGSGHRL